MESNRAIPNPIAEPTITAGRAAEIIGVSKRSVYAAIERGEMPSIKVGKRVVIHTARFIRQYFPEAA
jgi:excisionase family DNA binding protein